MAGVRRAINAKRSGLAPPEAVRVWPEMFLPGEETLAAEYLEWCTGCRVEIIGDILKVSATDGVGTCARLSNSSSWAHPKNFDLFLMAHEGWKGWDCPWKRPVIRGDLQSSSPQPQPDPIWHAPPSYYGLTKQYLRFRPEKERIAWLRRELDRQNESNE